MDRPKGKPWRDAIRRAVNKRTEEGKSIDRLAWALLRKAYDGDVVALKEIGDRLDGKAAQINEHGGIGGGPVVVTWLPPQ